MQSPTPEPTVDKDTGRLEAFSDGVFSIAMTLLILELKVPDLNVNKDSGALWLAICKQWPSYFAFLTSFATVLIMWVNHHSIFRLVKRCSGVMLFANGLLLLMVTIVPWPTALVAAYLRTPAATTACTLYSGVFVMVSVSYALLIMAAKKANKGLLNDCALDEMNRRLRNCWLIGFPMYLFATITAIFSPWPPLVICSILWVFWMATSMDQSKPFE